MHSCQHFGGCYCGYTFHLQESVENSVTISKIILLLNTWKTNICCLDSKMHPMLNNLAKQVAILPTGVCYFFSLIIFSSINSSLDAWIGCKASPPADVLAVNDIFLMFDLWMMSFIQIWKSVILHRYMIGLQAAFNAIHTTLLIGKE